MRREGNSHTGTIDEPTPAAPPRAARAEAARGNSWLGYFSSDRFAPMARPSYRIELWTVVFFSMTLAVVDNAFISVFVKQTFTPIAPPRLLTFIVALVGSASELANILSFMWASMSTGVRKVPFVNGLQLAVIVLVAGLALTPETPAGLIYLAIVVISARICWSGIILLRPTVWRANYTRDRASIVGRFSSIQQFIVAGMGLGLCLMLDFNRELFRFAAPIAAGMGLVALLITRQLRVRRERSLLREERDPAFARRIGRPWQGPGIVWRVLRQDRRFAQFMICMFVLGFGNLMLPAILVTVLRDQFHFGYFASVLIAAGIPYFLMPLAVPMWARLLDRSHVVHFRSIHSWAFVLATVFFLAAVALHSPPLLVLGSVGLAIAYAGGSIAWNLGHVDFSPPMETSQYMATHITLNGVRGLVAPLVSAVMYEQLLAWEFTRPQAASVVLGISLALSIAGGAGFIWLRHTMQKDFKQMRRTA
ncbi:MAG: MFS transporter [Phycisphaerales bacterium]|nr:MFS transporter [Phycisphaerales bacterium]